MSTKKGRISVSKNYLLHQSNEKPTKMDRTLEINQKSAAIRAVFIQEKQLNLRKNSELCGILTGLTSILSHLHSRYFHCIAGIPSLQSQ